MQEAAQELPAEIAQREGATASPWRVAWRRLRRKKLAMIALTAIALFYVVGLAAPAIAPYSYRTNDLEHVREGPSWAHPFGTDRLGRDQLSRVIWSARTTIIVTVATVLTASLALSVGLGLLSGYVGGKVDTAIMRTGEIFGSLPALPMLILINATMSERVTRAVGWLESHTSTEALRLGVEQHAGPQFAFLIVLGAITVAAVVAAALWQTGGRRNGALLLPAIAVATIIALLWAMQGIYAMPGAPSYFLVFGALSLFFWVGGARVIRSQVLALRETEYVLAARAMGASTWRVLGSHLLPNVAPLIIVGVSASLGAIAGSEIALTFIGVGVHEPTPSFGALLFDSAGQSTLRTHPYLLIFPAAVVSVLIFAFNLLGDAMNDVFTPRAR
jgi:ABC-type dipeptide/oligopeptide/nickel transport system permease subunit